MSICPRHLRTVVSKALHLAVWCPLLLGVGYGQKSEERVDDIPSAKIRNVIVSMSQGTYGPVTQKEIAEAEAGQLTPILEARFMTTQDSDVKARIARALVYLGDNDNANWDFLVQQAKSAIDSDAPSEHSVYVAWARAHNVSEDSQAEMALNWLLEERIQLVFGDPRGIPLLREALKSSNSNVVWAGADGLTRARDKDSIPLIVEACKRFHDADEVRQIAHTLRRFLRDPDARAAAQAGEEQCLPPPPPVDPAEKVVFLKQTFFNAQDERDKAQAASALIALGDKDDIYWDFLFRLARSVLEREAVTAAKNNEQERRIEEHPAEEAWASRDRDNNEMLTFVETVAETRNPRGIQLLRTALSSPNFQEIAAAGLVRAGDNDSIPLIIDVCKNASPEVASSIASQVLVYFDDPRAQSAVDRYLPDDAAKFAREEKANGVGPLGPWPPRK